ncbi:hypothetical protein BHE74_00019240 [Ensete ventricosum]|uniref:Uncharacterized protein n=1 Tax=Ensete ventricosum TaxID=4639 RepID=A0A427AR10_ENSVE|nr:hypothetical protein B296_00014024 [Ensete ventricosum]RWW34147.1 hypothetical protein GW17_00001085 [Ensete ventricosum]RWW72939.1 hypothetical protein BHE74_00019240 [Ensete ventricosum]
MTHTQFSSLLRPLPWLSTGGPHVACEVRKMASAVCTNGLRWYVYPTRARSRDKINGTGNGDAMVMIFTCPQVRQIIGGAKRVEKAMVGYPSPDTAEKERWYITVKERNTASLETVVSEEKNTQCDGKEETLWGPQGVLLISPPNSGTVGSWKIINGPHALVESSANDTYSKNKSG